MKDVSGDKKTIAKAVGKELAKRALSKGINKVVFDRGSYLFHGRVKSLAEGLKEGGLQV
jgi:large subunit ribosomal protein L18